MAASIGAIAVLVNLLAALAAAPVRLDRAAGAIDPVLADTARALGGGIVICTPTGLATIGPDGTIVGSPGEDSHGASCIFCLPLMAGGAAAPDTAAGPVYYGAELHLPPPVRRSAAMSVSRAGERPPPRAPPVA